MSSSTVKRVARNTIIMYLRMIVLIFIAFYSSRVLLSTLGVEDFGVYSVVGSISASFVALKSLFSESVQRFLNVAKGKKEDSLQEQVAIFNTGIVVHAILVVLFCVLVETIGIWLLNNKLSIPESRLDAAAFVFQMTVLSTIITIVSIPYDALIISNEKMGVYALISIIDAVLKLAFIFLLPTIGVDYLKSYSALLVTIPLSTLCFQLLYCRRFAECQYKFKIDRKVFKEVFNLSGWNFVGNISFSLIHEGINMILNVYGGVLLNAARAVSYQVKLGVAQLSTNTMIALRPRVMQMSVQHNPQDYYKVICLISRISFMTLLVVIVPLMVYCDEVLAIWLKDVPKNSVLFTRLVLLGLLIRSLHEPINMMNMAVGKIRRMMIIEAMVMTFFLVLVFICLRLFKIIWMPFALLSLMEIVLILLLVINAVREIGFAGGYYLKHVVIPVAFLLIVSTLLGYVFYCQVAANNIVILIVSMAAIFFLISGLCFMLMDDKEKSIVKYVLKIKNK